VIFFDGEGGLAKEAALRRVVERVAKVSVASVRPSDALIVAETPVGANLGVVRPMS
jgi:hypothetical protein